MGPGCGLQRDGLHAGDFQEALFEQPQDLEAALRKLLRLIGMFRGSAIEPGHEFIYARVVLHGAGAKRIHAQVDSVVPRRKAREVAKDFDLAHFGKTFNARAPVIGAESFGGIGGRHIERRQFERALSRRGLLKDESFALIGVARGFPYSFVHFPFLARRGAARCALRRISSLKSVARALASTPPRIVQSPRASSSP